MKQETGKKNKKLLWIILAAVALLVAAAVALAIFLQPADPDEGDPDVVAPESAVYWNIDRVKYTENSEFAGLSDRPKSEDGLYHFRMASQGQLMDMATADKRLVNYLDSLDVMGLVLDADGLIVNTLDVKSIAVDTATSFYVKKVDGDKVIINSSIAMNGMDMEIDLSAEGVWLMDARADSKTPGQSVALELMDVVYVYGTAEKAVESIFLTKRQPTSELYLRAERVFNSSTGKTARVPDENGVYTITFMKDGKAIDLKCKDAALVTSIDAATNDKQVMGLLFDEEGYITQTIAGATAIRGHMVCTNYNITEINGDTVTATRQMSGGGEGQTATFTMTKDTQVVMGEDGCCEYYGMLVEDVQLNDRVTVWTDLDFNAVYVYVDRRTVDSPMYYLMERKFNSSTKETTRQPNESGYYVYELACNGKMVTVKTKDKKLASEIDSYTNNFFGLKVEGSIIKDVYNPTCVSGGYGIISSSQYVTEVFGTIIRIAEGVQLSGGGNYMLTPDSEIYDLTGAYGTKMGQKTTLQVGDQVKGHRNLQNEITHLFVIGRYYQGCKLYYNYGRLYDSVAKETTRTPDAEGYYVFDVFCEGKEMQVKTKSRDLATVIDAQNAPIVAMKVSNGIVKAAYPAASANLYSQKCFNFNYVDNIKDGVLTSYYIDGAERYQGPSYKMSSKCKIYNVSDIFEDHRGEATSKIKPNDYIQAIRDVKTNEITHVWILRRKLVSPLYYHVNPVWISGETTRVPNADGYYTVDLFVDGQIKTFKTKDKAIMTQVDTYPEHPFAMETKGDIILKAGPATSSNLVYSQQANYFDVMKMSGNNFTVKDNREYSSNYNVTRDLKITKNTKIYDICGYSDQQWKAAKLNVGDRILAYADLSGELSYIFINYRFTRKEGMISECSHCGKEVFWEPFNGNMRNVNCHYYMTHNLSRGQVVVGKDPVSNPNAPVYTSVIDMNGMTFTSGGRNFLIYTNLTIVDSVGGGTLQALGYANSDGGNIYLAGGTVDLYDGVTLRLTEGREPKATKGGNIYISNNKTYVGKANIYDAVLEGWPVNSGKNITVGGNAELLLAGGTVKGGDVQVSATGKVSLAGDPKVECLNLTSGAKIVDANLTKGAMVQVAANGVFTQASNAIVAQKDYFAPATNYLPIDVKDGALWTEFDSSTPVDPKPDEPEVPELKDPNVDNSNLVFAQGTTKAVCPVCKVEVEWTPVTQATYGPTGIGSLRGDEHFYLAENITYNGTAPFVQAPSLVDGAPATSCFHLNGHNVTATSETVFVGYPGILNVMGNGTVSGYNKTGGQGAAVTINTGYATGTINLYGGTYTKVSGNDAASVISIWSSGGTVNMYKDVKVVGFGGGHAVRVNNSRECDSVLNILGSTIEGDIIRIIANSGMGHATKVNLVGAKIDEVSLSATNAVTVSGDLVVGKFDIRDNAKIILGELTENASITVKAAGVFTEANEKAADYAQYFKTTEGDNAVVVDNCLSTEEPGTDEPTEPSEPTQPSEPTEPSEPTDPSEPTVPTDSIYGTDNLPEGIEALKTAGNSLDDSDEAFFGTEGYLAKKTCPMCGATDVTWTLDNDGNWNYTGHYYADSETALDIGTNNFVYAAGKADQKVCVFVSGKTTITGKGFYVKETTGAYELNIMGNGTFISTVTDDPAFTVNGTVGAPTTVNLYGGTFKQKTPLAGYFGLQLYTNSILNMYDGVTIGADDRTATTGTGNVRVYTDTCTLNMYGGTIQNGYSNNGVDYGGNITLRGGTFNMYGGTITGGRTTNNGGNVHVSGGDFNMYGGTVSDGQANGTSKTGGNFYVNASGSLNIQGGTVSGGQAALWGGNIRTYANAAECKIGGTALIIGGTAGTGANIYGQCPVVIEGGMIVGEVALTNTATLTLKNAPVITTSYATLTGEKGLVLGGVQANIDALSADAKITVTAKLNDVLTAACDNAANVARCFTINGEGLIAKAENNQLVVVEGTNEPEIAYGTDNLPEGIEALKTAGNSLDDSDEAFFGTEGYLAKKTCPMCGATDVTWTLDNDGRWEDNGGHYYVDSDTALDLNGGWLIYAAGRHDRKVCVFASEGTTITGNGFYIGEVHGFQLNIMGNGTFISTGAGDQGFRVSAGTEAAPNILNLYGGTFYTTNTAKRSLFINNVATVNMYDGAVIGAASNEGATAGRGNVDMYNGIFNMYGGTIRNGYNACTANDEYGGNLSVRAGTFNMYGGTITGGKSAKNGGNVHVYGGDFNMYGGTVSNGDSGSTGGNFYVNNGSSLNIQGGTVSGGKTVSYGGNIRTYANAAECKIGGTALIIGGSAGTGANIYGQCPVVIEGGMIVGEVYLTNTATLTLKSAPVVTTSYATFTGEKGLVLGGVQANIDALSADAKITVTAKLNDVLTAASTNAANVVRCFTIDADGLIAAVENNQLVVVE